MTTPDQLRQMGYVEASPGEWVKPYRNASSRALLLDTATLTPQVECGDLQKPKFDLGSLFIVIKGDPVPAPRMTRRDKWLKPRRPCVQRYFDFRDRVRAEIGEMKDIPSTLSVVFHIPMPDSWSKNKRATMIYDKHRQRPDVDNCLKALMDAMFIQDGGVSDVIASKRWCLAGDGRIEMEIKD